MNTVSDLIFTFPKAIQEATSTLIGNAIGANDTQLAKRYFFFIMKTSIFLILFINACVLIFKN